jgi:hypothetical protein
MNDDGARPGNRARDERDGHDGSADATSATGIGSDPGTDDPAAVRARLTAASTLGGEAPLRVAMSPTPGVSAQRQPVVDGIVRDVELTAAGGDRYVLREGSRHTALVIGPPAATADGTVREVVVDGFRFEVETLADRRASLRERATRAGSASASTGPHEVRAVIPGKVVGVAVAVGDTVTAGQTLLVVEAMKMQNELRSPRDGTITRLGIGTGVNIELGDLLVVIS